ncbi:MAG: DNA-binding protein [Prevotellaceae bacterium]|jgi:predicted histone-like DNA-binding protein|nr:DNA-binding protein [Prevotellaceae bacterium]
MIFWKKVYRVINKKGLWYPQQMTIGKPVDTEELAEELMYESTVSVPDVHAVIRALPRVMAKFMADSRPVHLDGLGSFHYTIQAHGTGVKKEEEVNIRQITDIRVRFIPERKKNGEQMTRALVGDLTYTEWKGKENKTPSNPGETGDEPTG